MRRPDPAYRACFADGCTINLRYGRETMQEMIAQACGSVAAAFDEFVDRLRRLYLIDMPNFIDRDHSGCCPHLARLPSSCGLVPSGGSAHRTNVVVGGRSDHPQASRSSRLCG
jgi:phytoene desaturase